MKKTNLWIFWLSIIFCVNTLNAQDLIIDFKLPKYDVEKLYDIAQKVFQADKKLEAREYREAEDFWDAGAQLLKGGKVVAEIFPIDKKRIQVKIFDDRILSVFPMTLIVDHEIMILKWILPELNDVVTFKVKMSNQDYCSGTITIHDSFIEFSKKNDKKNEFNNYIEEITNMSSQKQKELNNGLLDELNKLYNYFVSAIKNK